MRHRLFAVVVTLIGCESRRGVRLGLGAGQGAADDAVEQEFRRKTRCPSIRGRRWCARSGRISTGCGNTRFGRRRRASRTSGTAKSWCRFAIESALSGVKKPVRPDERLWYRRTFKSSALADEAAAAVAFRRGRLGVHGLGQRQEVGQHTGGYDPFTFDITDALNRGCRQRTGRRGHRSDRHRHAAARQAGAEAAGNFLHGRDWHLADGVAGAGAGAVYRVAQDRAGC